MDTVEHALAKLVDQQHAIDALQAGHIDHARILDRHTAEIAALRDAAVERTITRAESLQHLATIDEALRREPATEDDGTP
jgi:lactate dehydrogenase-like 2-hydroxyacid dehydrogenase